MRMTRFPSGKIVRATWAVVSGTRYVSCACSDILHLLSNLVSRSSGSLVYDTDCLLPMPAHRAHSIRHQYQDSCFDEKNMSCPNVSRVIIARALLATTG